MAWPTFPDFTVDLNFIKKPLLELGSVISTIEAAIDALHPTVLTADATAVASNTLTAQAGLSRGVVAGTAYAFKIILFITAADEGLQFDLNGGSAAMTWIKAAATGFDRSSAAAATLAFASQTVTSLSTAFGPQSAFSGTVEIEGSFVPSTDGTFIPRIAQTAHVSGSVQVLKGSSIIVH
jgi:hypothetical protein